MRIWLWFWAVFNFANGGVSTVNVRFLRRSLVHCFIVFPLEWKFVIFFDFALSSIYLIKYSEVRLHNLDLKIIVSHCFAQFCSHDAYNERGFIKINLDPLKLHYRPVNTSRTNLIISLSVEEELSAVSVKAIQFH